MADEPAGKIQKKKQAIRFVLKIILFCIPLAILVGFPVWVFWRSGELVSNDAMVRAHDSNTQPVLIGLAFSNPEAYINLQSVISRGPEVLLLGSSRVGWIRSTFFNRNVNVYNAGISVQKIGDFTPFLDRIPADKTPKVMIIGLDQRFFNPNSDPLTPDGIDSLLTEQVPAMDVLSNWSSVYEDYFHGQISLEKLFRASGSRIGLEAIMKGSGFRNDGSYDAGPAIYGGSSSQALAYITQGNSGFEYSNTVSQGALTKLDDFLSACKSRNIYVIGVEPPFAPEVYEKMVAMPDQYGYLAQITPDASAIFKKYGFEFYDYTDPLSVGITDKDMMDSVHTTERGSLLFFASTTEKSAALRQYADPRRLEDALNATSAERDILSD